MSNLTIGNNRFRKTYRTGRGLSLYSNTGPETIVNIGDRSVSHRASFSPTGSTGRINANINGPVGAGFNGNPLTSPSLRAGSFLNNIDFNIANSSLSNAYQFAQPFNSNDFRAQTSVYDNVDPRLRIYPNSFINGYPVLNANNYGQLQTYSNGYPAPGQLSTYNYPYGQIFGYYPVAANQPGAFY